VLEAIKKQADKLCYIAPPVPINEEELKFRLDAVDNCLDLADRALDFRFG